MNARGIAFLDGLKLDLHYACRSLLRSPLAASTIVATIGVGLGLITVVFTVLNAFVFRVDAVRNPNELFAVERPHTADAAPPGFTRDQYDALARAATAFSGVFATTSDVPGWIEGRRREGRLVTGNFFQMLDV